MALVQCPDCGQQVSDAAPACVRCGRPLQPPQYQQQPYTPPQHYPPGYPMAPRGPAPAPSAGTRAALSAVRVAGCLTMVFAMLVGAAGLFAAGPAALVVAAVIGVIGIAMASVNRVS